jgi:hypothetical protein
MAIEDNKKYWERMTDHTEIDLLIEEETVEDLKLMLIHAKTLRAMYKPIGNFTAFRRADKLFTAIEEMIEKKEGETPKRRKCGKGDVGHVIDPKSSPQTETVEINGGLCKLYVKRTYYTCLICGRHVVIRAETIEG